MRRWSSEGTVLDRGELWDEQEAVECSLALADDGVTRCLPLSARLLFVDPGCQEAVLGAPGDCGSVFGLQTEGACPSQSRVLRGEGPTTIPDTVYSATPDGQCIATQGDPTLAYFAASPSPANTWVAFERSVTKITSDLGVQSWNGTDGSTVTAGFRLLPADVACSPVPEPIGAMVASDTRCIPEARAHPVGFADASCTEAVAQGDCPAPDVVKTEEGVGADSTSATYFQVGAQIEGKSVFQIAGGACKPLTHFQISGTYYRAGSPIPESTFPPLGVRTMGSGPVQGWYWESDGALLSPEVTHLVTTGATDAGTCKVVSFADGRSRCVSETAISDGYAEPSCTLPLGEGGQVPGGSSPVFRWVLVLTPRKCGARTIFTELRPVTGVHVGPIYRRSPTGSCSESTEPSSTVHYDAGDPVDPGVFPEVVETDG